jgi:hypothetical protein
VAVTEAESFFVAHPAIKRLTHKVARIIRIMAT